MKLAALRAAFERFERRAQRGGRRRAPPSSPAFVQREADWLDDYVLFRALRDRFASQPWWEWPDGLSTRQPSALAVARRSLEARDPLPRLPAVARRRAVAGGARRRPGSGCSATCRSWSAPTAPTSGSTRRSSTASCRSARRPTRSAPTARTGACRRIAGTCVERDDFALAAGPRPARHRALRRLPRRSRDRLLPHLRARRRRRRPLHARGSGGAEGARAEDHAGLPGLGRRHPGRGSRHRARTSCASR